MLDVLTISVVMLVQRPNKMVEAFIVDSKLALTRRQWVTKVSHGQRSTSNAMFERNCISVNKVQRHTFLRHDFVHPLYRLSGLDLFGGFVSET